MQNIADYLSVQKLAFTARIKGEEIYFTAAASSLFVIFLVNHFFGTGLGKVKYCECGCGVPLTIRQKRFATKQCKDRLRDKDDLQRVTTWLRVNKNRGKFTEEKYKHLCCEAGSLYEEGYNYKQIQEMLREKF